MPLLDEKSYDKNTQIFLVTIWRRKADTNRPEHQMMSHSVGVFTTLDAAKRVIYRILSLHGYEDIITMDRSYATQFTTPDILPHTGPPAANIRKISLNANSLPTWLF